jgi:hypothetical protein
MSEFINRFVSVVHTQHNTWSGKLVNFESWGLATISWGESHCEGSCFLGAEVSGAVLITESVSSDNNWLGPAWNAFGNVFDDNWLTEDSTAENVSNSAVGWLPHLLEVEFLNTSFIGCNCGTLYADLACFDCCCAINSDLVVCGITVLNAQVKVLNIQIQVRENKLHS